MSARTNWSDQTLARMADEIEQGFDPEDGAPEPPGVMLRTQADGRLTLPRAIFRHRLYRVDPQPNGVIHMTPEPGSEID